VTGAKGGGGQGALLGMAYGGLTGNFKLGRKQGADSGNERKADDRLTVDARTEMTERNLDDGPCNQPDLDQRQQKQNGQDPTAPFGPGPHGSQGEAQGDSLAKQWVGKDESTRQGGRFKAKRPKHRHQFGQLDEEDGLNVDDQDGRDEPAQPSRQVKLHPAGLVQPRRSGVRFGHGVRDAGMELALLSFRQRERRKVACDTTGRDSFVEYSP